MNKNNPNDIKISNLLQILFHEKLVTLNEVPKYCSMSFILTMELDTSLSICTLENGQFVRNILLKNLSYLNKL